MLIEVTPSQSDSFFNISNNVTTLLAAVNGSELGLRGDHHMYMYNVHSLEMMKTCICYIKKKLKCHQKHAIWLLLCLNNSTSTYFMKILKIMCMWYTVCWVKEVFGYSGSSVLSISQGMASKMSMNVSMMLPIKWNEAVCTDKNCQKIQILTCINFQGPASIFPSKR